MVAASPPNWNLIIQSTSLLLKHSLVRPAMNIVVLSAAFSSLNAGLYSAGRIAIDGDEPQRADVQCARRPVQRRSGGTADIELR
ncbi:hypothetical protein FOS14_13885 [Skermania sp. ID1734]|uniref:hypothetical protein n=1 Tax=Skermania sp. ID1734 TaxID=2597516 RepID=UPI001180FBE6|nr:hypothetical protein [Skermania sp. ID1734]TSD98083.1 hypothetical protein FOS14_13885 [Skermania sp. ID1734]